jgi:5,5'-dehydrodivanillate O-demethylase
MLTQQENEQLTRVGPGTAAGELLRRYWHPIALGRDLTVERPKKRVRVLGEDLVLFRDPTGSWGLIAEQCAHRGASVYYGFLEDGGIRCPYHGWLYDRTGRCLEQPFEPQQSMLRQTVRLPAYPVQEVRGLLFAYLGPQPIPRIPPWDVIVREDGAHSIRVQPILEANWLQVQETNLDPTHIVFLHQRMKAIAQGRSWRFLPIDGMEFEQTEWGIVKRRRFGGDSPLKEEAGHPALFPNLLWHGGRTISLYWRTPLDDTHTQSFWLGFTPGAARDESDDEYPPVTFDVLKHQDGEFHMITPASQDAMAWETQGPIRDRLLEHLGASDRGVTMWRELVARQIQKVQRGEDPMGVVRDPDLDIIAFTNEAVNKFELAVS